MSLTTFDPKVFTSLLKDNLKEKFKTFHDAIVEGKALIAGGSVLGAYAGFDVVDVDIYIHYSKANRFIEHLLSRCGARMLDSHLAPAYDMSFFKKNNIMMRFPGVIGSPYFRFDLMVIPDNHPLETVVQNFDLTFCEIWYDGKNIFATDEQGIRNKRGFLRKEYVESFVKYSNVYIAYRMKKYTERGFQITIKIPNQEYVYELREQLKKKLKNIASPEEWVVKFVFNMMTSSIWASPSIFRHSALLQEQIMKKVKTTIIVKMRECTMPVMNRVIKKYYMAIFKQHFKITKDVSLKHVYMYHIAHNFRYMQEPYRGYLVQHLKLTPKDIEILTAEGVTPDGILKNVILGRQEAPSETSQTALPSLAKADQGKCKEYLKETKTGTDIFLLDDNVNLDEFLKSDDSLVFVNPDNKAFCYSRETIATILNDKDDNWFYECLGHIIPGRNDRGMIFDLKKPYVGLPLDITGLKGYFPAGQVMRLLKSKSKVFFIKPHMEGRIHKMLTHTASHRNAAPGRERDFVSANHCQAGTNVLVYDIEKCVQPVRIMSESRTKSKSKSASKSKSGYEYASRS